MDHLEAVSLHVTEKYVLGELTPDLREQFEEHYFDCAECARNVQALATFVTASRMVLEEKEISSKAPSRLERAERSDWLRWLRPAIALPAIAILVAMVVYQKAVTISSVRESSATQGIAQVYESSYRLQGATRGGNPASVRVRSNESFGLDFDFTPAQVSPNYKGNLVDSSGRTVLPFRLTAEETNKEIHLVIPGGIVHAGKYDLVVTGNSSVTNQSPKESEVLRIPFIVTTEP
jgi:hypothetical protein